MTMQEDLHRRADGQRAHQALEALGGLIESRGTQTLAEAEAMHLAGELTPEKAYALLVTLLEQKRLLAALEGDVREGLHAARRIQKTIEADQVATARAEMVPLQGRNRFMRSRRPPPPPKASA